MTDTERKHRTARIQRAVARAWQMSRAGVVPVLVAREDAIDGTETYQTWVVPSRTETGRLYTVELLADATGRMETSCSCPAGVAGSPCWHRMICRACVLGNLASDDATAPAIAPVGFAAEPDWDDAADFAAVA